MIEELLKQYNLQPKEYIGHLHNQKQYEYLLEKTAKEKIVIIGDLLNDYDDDVKQNLWVIRSKDIVSPPRDRALVLYYKNEQPNKKTIDENDFLAYYTIADQMIKSRALKSFNKLKIICRDSVPSYYDSLDCEKHLTEMGRKSFDLYCNLYANTVWFTTASANYAYYASKAIITRNIYDTKKTVKDASVLFDYVYCPIDQSGQYTDGDEFIWDNGAQSTYRKKYGNIMLQQQDIPLLQKTNDFIKCILELDSHPLYNI